MQSPQPDQLQASEKTHSHAPTLLIDLDQVSAQLSQIPESELLADKYLPGLVLQEDELPGPHGSSPAATSHQRISRKEPDSMYDSDRKVVLSESWGAKGRANWRSRKPCEICGWSTDESTLFYGEEVKLVQLRTSATFLRRMPSRDGLPGCTSCTLLVAVREALCSLYEGDSVDIRISKGVMGRFHVGSHIWQLFLGRSEALYLQTLGFEIKGNNHAAGGSDPDYADFFIRQTVSCNTGSETALNWARQMFNQCKTSHGTCRVRDSSFLPTRLLDLAAINHGGLVRLVDGSALSTGSSYTALSHCWGAKLPKCLTTRDTISDRRAGIPWEIIPPTFQNAIHVTIGLGISYLWIDSVCIIQQDPQDWSQEAGKMFHVYQNADVTLCAGYAVDSDGGLFHHTDAHTQFKLATFCDGTKDIPIYIAKLWEGLPYHPYDMVNETQRPLFTRAWTFQERLVSPRSLIFTSEELFYECYRDSYCECSRHGSVSLSSLKSDFVDNIFHNKPEDRPAHWHALVSMYSYLHLSHQADKLPAIGALAEWTHKVRSDETYLAGNWSKTLHQDLLWHTETSRIDNRGEWVAPSWSWASIISPVKYGLLKAPEPRAIVLHTTCEYEGHNAFGRLAKGSMICRGRIMPCGLRRVKWNMLASARRFCFRFYTLARGTDMYFGAYTDEEEVPNTKLPPLPLTFGGQNITSKEGGDSESVHIPAAFQLDSDSNNVLDPDFKKDFYLFEIANTPVQSTSAHDPTHHIICLLLEPVSSLSCTYRRVGLAGGYYDVLDKGFCVSGHEETCTIL